MPTRVRLAALALVSAACALAGCAAPTSTSRAEPTAELTEAELRTLPLYDGRTGERVRWDDAARDLASADAVLFGELHGHPVGLPAAALLFADMAEITPDRGALALEFLERDVQHHLDDYLADVTDRDAFGEAAGLTPNSYPAGHEAMVETAKAKAWPVSAANAPRRYVRLSRTEGFDRLRALTPAQQALFVIPARLDDGPYRDRFFEIMGAMRGQASKGREGEATEPDAEAARKADERVESFFRAQQVWDHTMADSVAELVNAGRSPVVLVIGRFHTDFEGGTVTALRPLLPSGAQIRTVTFADRDLGLLGLDEEDRGIADYVLYTGPSR